MSLGSPRVHRRQTGSSNADARALALAGAPHGTLVTASEQTAGRGRNGRSWHAPAGSALLCSLILRAFPRTGEQTPLLSLAAGVAVAAAVGERALLKWPNDVLLPQPGTGDPRKVGGILVEARPREAWAVVGIGLNVAVRVAELPPELAGSAGTLGLERSAIEPLLERLLATLEHWLERSPSEVLDAWRARDALLGRPLRWDGGTGVGRGVDDKGHLLVDSGTARHVLDAGEVHLGA